VIISSDENKLFGYAGVALKNKIAEMYPEIEKQSVSVSLAFSKENNACIVIFQKGDHLLMTPLGKKDVVALMDGVTCYYLDRQIARFVRNVGLGEKTI
jgi:predicted transport protein